MIFIPLKGDSVEYSENQKIVEKEDDIIAKFKFLMLSQRKQFSQQLIKSVIKLNRGWVQKWINTKVGQNHSWKTTLYVPSNLE